MCIPRAFAAMLAIGLGVGSVCAQPVDPVVLGSTRFDGVPIVREDALGTRVRWFRFELTEAITPQANWLDLDTSGSQVDTKLALYTSAGVRLSEGLNAGAGTAAANSFGYGSLLRFARSPGGGTLSIGQNTESVPHLLPGTYYIGVAGEATNFPATITSNWDLENQGTSGSLVVSVYAGRPAVTSWKERDAIDAGELLMTAQQITGTGKLETIIAQFTNGRDMFKFRIVDPSSFSANFDLSGPTDGVFASRVFLFDSEGRGVTGFVSNAITTPAALTSRFISEPGDYYLLVERDCGGSLPRGAGDVLIWDPSLPNGRNIELRPNGPGPTLPLQSWPAHPDCNCSGECIMKITLTGCNKIPVGCPADVDDGTGLNRPDGGISIDDLLYFLERFADGC